MKQIVSFAILLFSMSMLYAQRTKVTYGVGLGVNLSNATYDYNQPVKTDSRTGFAGYMFLNLPASEQFSVQTEIGYYAFGTRIDNKTFSNNWFDLVSKINYLNFSVLPKIHLKGTGLGFYLGPSLGIKLNSDIEETGSIDPSRNIDGVFLSNDFKSTDFMVVAGAEYYFPIGIGFSARYMQGLTNILNYSFQNEKYYNHSFAFSIAYRFK